MSTKKETRPSQIRLDNVQFSWPFIFEKDDSDKPKYRVDILISKKDKKSLAKIQEAMKYAYLEGVKNPKMWNGNKPKKWHNPMHDGDAVRDTTGEEKGPEYKGRFHFTASSQREVQVVNKSGKTLESDDEFFGGCIGSVIINFAAYKERKIGIGAYVNAICVTDDSERFGGGAKINVKDAFSDLLEDSGDFDFNDSDDADDDDDDIFDKPKKSAPKKQSVKKTVSKKKAVQEDDDDDAEQDDDDDETFNPFG